MGLFKGLQKYSAVLYLIMFFASASLAAANELGLASGTNDPTMRSAKESSIKTCLGTGSDCFIEYSTTFRNAITEQKWSDIPLVASTNEYFKDTLAIALHKDGEKIIWSLAPSVGKFSLNPLEDVKKLQVVLHYTLWF